MSNIKQTSDRIARTRRFFEYESWGMDATDAWQHILVGACDDEDLHDNKSFSALDIDCMFGEYRAFNQSCKDASHYLAEHIDDFFHLAGVIYIDGNNGAIEFVDTDDNRSRAEWLFSCAQGGNGVLLRAIVDSVGAVCIELVA